MARPTPTRWWSRPPGSRQDRAAEYHSALSAPCIYTSQSALTGSADPDLYGQFAERFELQVGTQDVVLFDATDPPPSRGGSFNAYRPDIPVSFTAH